MRKAVILVVLLLFPAVALAGSITVTQPNTGGSFPLNSELLIKWTAQDVPGTVMIILRQGNAKIGDIASGINPLAGQHLWTVGQYIGGNAPTGSNYVIRVRTPDGTISDDSDVAFSITPQQEGGGDGGGSGGMQKLKIDPNILRLLLKPDLKVGNIVVTPAANCTSPLTWHIPVLNVGKADVTENVFVQQYLYYWGANGTTNPGSQWNEYYEAWVPGPVKGGSTMYAKQVLLQHGGKWVLKVLLDKVYYKVAESDEDNNEGSGEFWTPDCPH